ncbi:MAG: serine/threonine protein kinase [Blastocatellia bacterium]
MSTVTAQRLPVIKPDEQNHVTRVLGQRFEFLDVVGLSGPAKLYSVTERGSAAYTRRPDSSLVLKVLDAIGDAEPAQLELFRAQSRAAALLDHDCITPVLESGELNGIEYCLLSFPAQFETLRHMITRRGWLDIQDSVAYGAILQVCDALSHAHERAVLHLAVRPEEILIDSSGKVSVTGFGLARDDLSRQLLDQLACQIAPQYLSPELLSGENPTERSDLYPLGVTLYEMITDRLPCAPGDGERGRRARPGVPPHLIMEEISPEISGLTMKMLADDPANRFLDIADFQMALIAATGRNRPGSNLVSGCTDVVQAPVLGETPDNPDPISIFEEDETVIASNEVDGGDLRPDDHSVFDQPEGETSEAEIDSQTAPGDIDVNPPSSDIRTPWIAPEVGSNALNAQGPAVMSHECENVSEQVAPGLDDIRLQPVDSHDTWAARNFAGLDQSQGRGSVKRIWLLVAGLIILIAVALVIAIGRSVSNSKSAGRGQTERDSGAPELQRTVPGTGSGRASSSGNDGSSSQSHAASQTSSPDAAASIAPTNQSAKWRGHKSQDHRRARSGVHRQGHWRHYHRYPDYYR